VLSKVALKIVCQEIGPSIKGKRRCGKLTLFPVPAYPDLFMNAFSNTRLHLLLAWLLIVAAGWAPGFAQIIGPANDHFPAQAATSFTVSDSATGTLASGSRVDFGRLDLGSYKTQSFTVANSFLTTTVTGLTCTLSGADAADFVLSAGRLADLAVGASANFSVTYVPELVGKVSAAVLHVRDAHGTSYEFPLTATAGDLNPTVLVEEVDGAVVTSLSRPLDFGSPMLGQSTSKTFRITNTGTAPLREVSVARDDPWSWGGWSGCDPRCNICAAYYNRTYIPTYQFESGFIVSGDITSVIPAGESRTFTVTWKPYETVPKTRNITLSWAVREPPPTYDLTSPVYLFLGSFNVLNLTCSICGCYYSQSSIPPVRFSIPVTGNAVPYALEPAPLGGLEYHLGNENTRGLFIFQGAGNTIRDPMLGPAQGSGPDDSGLLPNTLARWKPSALISLNSINNTWRSLAQAHLTLSPRSVPDVEASQTYGANVVKSPMSVFVTGAGSATEALGSQVAVAFTSGNRLSNPDIQLPASDNVGMELWLKPSTVTGTQCVAFLGADSEAGFGLWMADGILQGRAGSSKITASLPALRVDEWHHVAFVVQDGSASLYMDGVLSGHAPSVSLPATVRGLSIGAMLEGGSGYEGQVDELRLFEIPTTGFDIAHDLLANARPSSILDQMALDFGNVVPTAQTQRSATLTNTGPGWLRVLSMELTGEGASDYRISALGPWNGSTPIQSDPTPAPVYPQWGGITITIGRWWSSGSLPAFSGVGTSIEYRTAVAPRTRLEAQITHIAAILGPRPARLRITTNDPVQPIYEIALNAMTVDAPAPKPKIHVGRVGYSDGQWQDTKEAFYDWGTLLTNQESNSGFQISNHGSAPLANISVELIGPHAEDITLSGTSVVGGRFQAPSDGFPAGTTRGFNLSVRPRAAGARYAALRITSDDPARPEIIIPIYGRAVQALPEIAVSFISNPLNNELAKPVADGGSMAFAPVLSGGLSSTLTCRIHNIGTVGLNVSRVSIDGADAADFAVEGTLPTIVDPYNSIASINLRFTPSRVGPHSATLHITSDDADESPYDITLTGMGLSPGPVLQVVERGTPISSGTGFLRFGTAIIRGDASTQRLTLKNIGTAPLTTFTATVTGPNASEFIVSLPTSIAGLAEAGLAIHFQPKEIGPRSAELTLTSNDPQNSPYRISLGGTGAYGPRSNLSPMAIPGWVGTALAELPDGSIAMAGYEEAAEGAAITSRLRIIGKDGSERTPLSLQKMTISGTVKSICLRADGSLLLAGDFTKLWGSIPPSNVITGRWDSPGYDPRPFLECQGVAMLLTNSVWMPSQLSVCDAWLLVSSQTYPLAWSTSFTPPTGTFSGRAVLALPDGKVLVGGSGSLAGRANLIRLNADGTLDTSFTLAEPNGPVNALALQDDGKVLVGGEFTNLGHDKLASETTASTTFPTSTTPRTGLCRLHADGSDDPTFANRGFHQVMALATRGDCIAVGGMEKQYSAIIIGHINNSSAAAPPGYVEIDQAKAQLLGRDGKILATHTQFEIPRTVALQLGNRMVFPVKRRFSIDVKSYPSIAVLQPDSAPAEWFGVSIARDVMPESIYESFQINYQRLLRSDEKLSSIHAILSQSDGKVLAVGDFNIAAVKRDPAGYSSEGDQRLPQPTPLLPVLDNSALPAETPLAGFAQLDVDGFYHASPIVISPSVAAEYAGASHYQNELLYMTTDGLAKIEISNTAPIPASGGLPSLALSSSVITRPGLFAVGLPQLQSGPISVTIDGPDAAAFAHAEDPFPLVRAAVMWGPQTMFRQFTPTHQGKHYAVLKVQQPGIDNDFEIALEGNGSGSLPDQVRLTDAKNLVLQSADQREMGGVALGASASLDLRLCNDSTSANITSFELSLTGPHASEFSVSPVSISGIPAKSRNGAGLMSIQVTFTPTSLGPRMATLNLVAVSSGPVSQTPMLPFVINLTGEGLAAPLAFTTQPQDVLVMQGSAFSLSFATNSTSRGMNGAWYHQRGSRDRIVQEFLAVTSGAEGPRYHSSQSYSIASASAEDAGLYRAVIQNGAGQIYSRAAQVGVVSVLNRDVFVGRGQVANLGVSFTGPPTFPGQSSALYQWLFMGQPLTNSPNISGANSPNLTLAKVESAQAGAYTCQITLGAASLTTPPITVSLIEKPQVTGLSNLAWAVAQPVDSAILFSGHVQQFTAQGLPPGVRLNTTTGQLSGRPTKAGSYTLRITVRNAAGISAPVTTRVVVLPLAEDIFGSYFGTIYRNPEFNDGLGGTWSLTVTTTGAYSAKLNLATSELSRKKKGKMKTLTLSGAILSRGDSAETVPVSLPHPSGGAALQVSCRLTAKTVVNGEDQHTAAILFLKENHRDQSNGAAFGRAKTPRAATGRFSSGSDQKFDLWVSTSGASFWTAKVQTDSGHFTLTGSAPFMTWDSSLFLHQILPHPTQPSSIVGFVQWVGLDTWAGQTDLRKPESVTTEETNGVLIPRNQVEAKRVRLPTQPPQGPASKRF
jgi:uncharacterized delta-60 repeat protein